MSIKSGDVFLYSIANGDKRLHVVITDADSDDGVYIVRIDPLDECWESLCVLEPIEDHSSIEVTSVVVYEQILKVKSESLRTGAWSQEKEPFTEKVMQRIYDGAKQSNKISRGALNALIKQNKLEN